MKTTLLSLLFIAIALLNQAQNSLLQGRLVDHESKPLAYATVALMRPADSTLQYYAVTNSSGDWQIGKVAPGDYLFQVAYMGFSTINLNVQIPAMVNNLRALQMSPKTSLIGGVEVTAEHIPLLIKKDTVEYNAGAFKVKPGGVAEDVLRKLPGVEVDRAGNIKAMGEEVRNVLVDGKEFFSNDPKVATKNLPADAIQKVQVYDKKSEEADLSGIEDGQRDKTVNFILKEGQKQAWIGEVSASGGTGDHYAANAKVYRFTKTKQIAMLGMVNNINKSGFSLQDYLDFNGGLAAMMAGGGSMRMSLSFDNTVPVDFGGGIDGLLTSGAAGINYSVEPEKNRRYFGSYLGNGSEQRTNSTSITRYFYSNGESQTDATTDETATNFAHRLNIGLRDRSDSTVTVTGNLNAGITTSRGDEMLWLINRAGPVTVSSLQRATQTSGNRLMANFAINRLKKLPGSLKLFKLNATGSTSHAPDETEWQSLQGAQPDGSMMTQNSRSTRLTDMHQLSLSTSGLFRVAHRTYLQAQLKASGQAEITRREQSSLTPQLSVTDSLSPAFDRWYYSLVPSLSLRKNWKKLKTNFTLALEAGQHNHSLNHNADQKNGRVNLLPSATLDYDISTGHHLSMGYSTAVNNPTASQLNPVLNNTNPLVLYYGNPLLRPEYQHQLMASWMLFDQFSQTSVFASVNGTYTRDKINLSRQVDSLFRQTIRLINVQSDLSLSGSISFSTPIRPVGLTVHLQYSGAMSRGQNRINGQMSDQTNLTHEVELSFDNKKKEIIDFEFGGKIAHTTATYTVQPDLNSQYLNYSLFADVNLTPSDRWFVKASADVVNYTNQSFGDNLTVPLLDASVGLNFLKNKRATLSVDATDILDKNKGISRLSEQNYLKETFTNTLGRTVMLTLRFRLNKYDTGGSGIEIKTGRR